MPLDQEAGEVPSTIYCRWADMGAVPLAAAARNRREASFIFFSPHVFKLGFQDPPPVNSTLTHHVLQTHCCDCSGLEADGHVKLLARTPCFLDKFLLILQDQSLILPPASLP